MSDDWGDNEDAGDAGAMGAADASAFKCDCGRWKDETWDYCNDWRCCEHWEE